MTLPTECQRLRIGGTVSGSIVTGGTVIETYGSNLLTWNGLLGQPGRQGRNYRSLGSDGTQRRSSKDYDERLITLELVAYDRDDTGTITSPDGACGELFDNIDMVGGLLDAAGEAFILERDLPDGSTRWIAAEVLTASSWRRGPVFGPGATSYAITVFATAHYPFWQSDTLHEQVVSGAINISNAGNARISNMELVYAGDAVLTHVDSGDTLEVAGSSGAVTVDVGAKSVTEGGTPAGGLLIPSRRYWMRWGTGTVALNRSGANVTARWRDHWLT
jgi:hypothetical protein